MPTVRLGSTAGAFNVAALVLLIAVELAHGSDYAREQKWADEITPNLVVGHALYLEGRAGRKVLALYTEAAAMRRSPSSRTAWARA